MELPFSPAFFRKIDVFQQLKDFESEGKPIWEAEKLVLEWAAGPGHRHLGSYLNTGHVRNVLEEAQRKGRLPQEAIEFIESPQHVLNSLANRHLGDKWPRSEPEAGDVKINRDGFVAGKVLGETGLLRKAWKYEIWTGLWWSVLILGFILLLAQAARSVIGLFPE